MMSTVLEPARPPNKRDPIDRAPARQPEKLTLEQAEKPSGVVHTNSSTEPWFSKQAMSNMLTRKPYSV